MEIPSQSRFVTLRTASNYTGRRIQYSNRLCPTPDAALPGEVFVFSFQDEREREGEREMLVGEEGGGSHSCCHRTGEAAMASQSQPQLVS